VTANEMEWAMRIAGARPEWARGVLAELGFTEEVSAAIAARFAR